MSRFHRRLNTCVVILAISQSVAAALPVGRTSTQPATSSAPSDSSRASSSQPGGGAETKPEIQPQVEVFVPSAMSLVKAAKRSRSAALFDAFSGMIPKPNETDDEALDLGSAIRLIEKIGDWSDTSVALAIFTEDRDGRPRWTLRIDWSLDVLVENLNGLLQDEAASKLLKDVRVKRAEGGAENESAPYRLEVGDDVLAVLSELDSGSLIASARELRPPDSLFGQPTQKESSASGDTNQKKAKRSLIYCRLNLGADSETQSNSLFSRLSGIHDVLYGASLSKNGQWSEKFSVSWNPLVGLALKAMFQKTDRPFDCPQDAYALAVMNLGLSEGLADSLAGMPPGTIGGRSGSEMAVAVTPGTGFLPLPDVFYQFRARKKAEIINDVRKFVAKANKARRDDDRPLEWQEIAIDGQTVFCKTPLGNGGSSLLPARFRTVVFFHDAADAGESKKLLLIIAQTSTWAEDAVRRWDELSRKTYKMPSSSKAHWQSRIRWKKIYELAGPILTLMAGFSDDAEIPPDAEELSASLADAVINIKIGYGGLNVRHTGPLPIGAVYVPAVAAVSLGSSSSPSSESARERVAARHLRVLYHHAKLFRKDYDRWPATVAELDGYVDFASHAELLRLRPKAKSFVEGLTSILTASAFRTGNDEDGDDDGIDDSLYVIKWTGDETGWRLGFREGELAAYKTMYIDAEGEIHRVENDKEPASPRDGTGDGGTAEEESAAL